jgi:hypothetical protein
MKHLNEIFHEVGMTDKHTVHGYGYFYSPLLEHKRLTAESVLEIGVSCFGGGSLIALGLFFEYADVHGIDIKPCNTIFPENVSLHIGDGYDDEYLEWLRDIRWDVVLDDGPHTLDSQIHTLNFFYDKLASNGFLLIEDVNPRNIRALFDKFVGDKMRLSLVNRTLCPRHNKDEYIVVYM